MNNFKSNIQERITLAENEALDRKHIFLLPSKNGCIFIAACLVMIVFGINYENNLVLLVAIFFMSSLVTSIYLSFRNIHGVRVSILTPQSNIYAENVIALPIHIQKNKNDLIVKEIALKSEYGPELYISDVQEENNSAVSFNGALRGIYQIPRLKIVSNYPLGLINAFSYINPSKSILIFPKPIRNDFCLNKLPENTTNNNNLQVKQNITISKGFDEIAGIKPYRPGDSTNLIDWRQLAMGRGLMIKDFSTDQNMNMFLTEESIKATDIETQISMLTFAVIELTNNEVNFGFSFHNIYFAPNSGFKHQQKILEKLAVLMI